MGRRSRKPQPVRRFRYRRQPRRSGGPYPGPLPQTHPEERGCWWLSFPFAAHRRACRSADGHSSSPYLFVRACRCPLSDRTFVATRSRRPTLHRRAETYLKALGAMVGQPIRCGAMTFRNSLELGILLSPELGKVALIAGNQVTGAGGVSTFHENVIGGTRGYHR